MSLTEISRIGKKRVLVIPKAIADQVGLREGSRVKITSSGGKIIIEPIVDAIWLSLHGRKIGKVSSEEIEEESVAEQEKYIERG